MLQVNVTRAYSAIKQAVTKEYMEITKKCKRERVDFLVNSSTMEG